MVFLQLEQAHLLQLEQQKARQQRRWFRLTCLLSSFQLLQTRLVSLRVVSHLIVCGLHNQCVHYPKPECNIAYSKC